MGRLARLLSGAARRAPRPGSASLPDLALVAAAFCAGSAAAHRLGAPGPVVAEAAGTPGPVPATPVARAGAPLDLPPGERPRPGAAPGTPRAAAAATLPRAGAPSSPAAEVDRLVRRLLGSTGQRRSLEAALGRMSAYEPLVRGELRQRGVPQELRYLAVIESEYQPRARSRAGAVGLWQFMPGTAELYGLEVSDYVDERRDPVASTRAAVRYLDDLHREFGSWHLALAAYNAGSPRVWRLLQRYAGGGAGRELQYWRIRPYLPGETRGYVPRFLAAMTVAERAREFGLAPRAARPLAFREVWVAGGTSLAEVAAARGLAAEEVVALNLHLVRRMTPPGRPWRVRLPAAPDAVPQPDGRGA